MSDMTHPTPTELLAQMILEMRNFADVADRCEVTNAPPAIRTWADQLEALAASEPAHTCDFMDGMDDCAACVTVPEQPGKGEAMVWTEEDMQRPWGAEVAFLRHLADDPAVNEEQSMLLLHCAKRIERTSAVECVPDWIIAAINKADELLELEDYSATDLKAARDYLKERANLPPQPPDPADGDAAYRGTVIYRQHADGWCVSREHHDAKVQEIHDDYRERLSAPPTAAVSVDDAERYRFIRENCYFNFSNERDWPHFVIQAQWTDDKGDICRFLVGKSGQVGVIGLDDAVDRLREFAALDPQVKK